jgi:flagellar FliL protein
MTEEAKEAAESPEQEPAGKGRRGLVMMLGTAALAAAVGAAGTVAVQHVGGEEAPPPEAESAHAADAAAPAAPAAPAPGVPAAQDFQQRLLALDPIVVNVAGGGGGRFLKVKVELETDSVAAKDELGLRLPQVKDAVITVLSSKQLADLADFEGKVLLKEELRNRIDELLTAGKLHAVLITEFVVQ